jgi:membrane protein implicated in regulation of membrane protease activity/DNA-binding XRE family transcriptional regulator
MPWWAWVLVGVLALAGESASMALFLLNVGIAAFVAAVLAVLGVAALGQAGVFVLVSVILIGLVRPRLLQALVGRGQPRPLTTQEALIGRVATVTEPVTDVGGMVRLGRGEFWTARTTSAAQQIKAGSRVRIARVEGLTAYVEPVAAAPGLLAPGGLGPVEGGAGREQDVATVQFPTFGELLKAHRLAANLTQEDLAEQARISVRAISDLERGLHRTPQKDTVHLLADALQLSAQDRAAFEAAARRLGDSSASRLRV